MIAELAALALSCAPNIHPITLDALIHYESGAQQYAIGVNRRGSALPRQPKNLEVARKAAEHLIAQGIDFDAGLGQINVRNWAWLGLTSTTVFDPCRNLAATQSVLSDCYARALESHRSQQQALRAALSCYNTGNFRWGFTNGYVRKVLAQAGIRVPALKPIAAPGKTAADPAATQAKDLNPTQPAEATTGNDPVNPDRLSTLQDNPPETRLLGSPDGFTSHQAADGFIQPAL